MTYPDEIVKTELTGHWLTTRIDVSERETVAASFGVSAIPTAVVVSADGEVLGRLLGFVEPEQFGERLAELRGVR